MKMNKKSITAIIAAIAVSMLMPALSGCGTVAKALLKAGANKAQVEETSEDKEKEEETKKDSEKKTKKKKHKDKDKEKDDVELTEDMYRCDPDEVFAAMSDWSFVFSSGAGGWGTELYVNPDGSFSGVYHDSEMGDTDKGYPNGTVYECKFSGHFDDKIMAGGPLIYKLIIKDMDYEKKPGEEEIVDGIRYIYTEPYGLEGLVGDEDNFLFLDAGVVTQIFTEEELHWLSPTGFGNYLGEDWDYVTDVPEELPFAALFNQKDDLLFFSGNRSDKNKTYLVNKVQIPGLHNVKSTMNSDNTYYYVDENDDASFRVINTCFATKKRYDSYSEADKLVNDAIKEIYGKDAPAASDVYVYSPKDAYSMQYCEMIVGDKYSDSALWHSKGSSGDTTCEGRFLVSENYEADTSYVYAYIIETTDKKIGRSFPDGYFENPYISSLTLTGKNEKLSSATDGNGAVKSIMCEMQTPDEGNVLAKEAIMVSESDKELIKKYHLEDADFYDDYEMVFPDNEFHEYHLADDSYTPFYVQYPKDGIHRLYYAYDLDEYMGTRSEDNTRLMRIYLNKDNEIVYAYEVYTP